jgi:hypothetical protein
MSRAGTFGPALARTLTPDEAGKETVCVLLISSRVRETYMVRAVGHSSREGRARLALKRSGRLANANPSLPSPSRYRIALQKMQPHPDLDGAEVRGHACERVDVA